MSNIRLIARLDVKAPNLVKGVQLEGLRKLGDPNEFARSYYNQGIDEIVYIDVVASLYERNSLFEVVSDASKNIFVPLMVGGGLRSCDDVEKALNAGADRIAINTAAIKNPELISKIANRFGSQCMVLSIQASRHAEGKWEAYYDNGREHSYLDPVEWAQRGYKLGAGEILLTSIDQEGTTRGMDVELIRSVSNAVSIPVIASGGVGSPEDFIDAVKEGGCNAVAMASILHYRKFSISEIRAVAQAHGIEVRHIIEEMKAAP
jgi:cyclase